MTEDELMQVIERAAKKDLQSLNLSNNQLSSLPPEIRKLEQLTTIDLRGNPIPIPPEILGPKQIWETPGDIRAILDF
jgi:internalin A